MYADEKFNIAKDPIFINNFSEDCLNLKQQNFTYVIKRSDQQSGFNLIDKTSKHIDRNLKEMTESEGDKFERYCNEIKILKTPMEHAKCLNIGNLANNISITLNYDNVPERPQSLANTENKIETIGHEQLNIFCMQQNRLTNNNINAQNSFDEIDNSINLSKKKYSNLNNENICLSSKSNENHIDRLTKKNICPDFRTKHNSNYDFCHNCNKTHLIFCNNSQCSEFIGSCKIVSEFKKCFKNPVVDCCDKYNQRVAKKCFKGNDIKEVSEKETSRFSQSYLHEKKNVEEEFINTRSMFNYSTNPLKRHHTSSFKQSCESLSKIIHSQQKMYSSTNLKNFYEIKFNSKIEKQPDDEKLTSKFWLSSSKLSKSSIELINKPKNVKCDNYYCNKKQYKKLFGNKSTTGNNDRDMKKSFSSFKTYPERFAGGPNYKELLKEAYALKNAKSENDLNMEIIRKTLKCDVQFETSCSDTLSKDIYTTDKPNVSNINEQASSYLYRTRNNCFKNSFNEKFYCQIEETSVPNGLQEKNADNFVNDSFEKWSGNNVYPLDLSTKVKRMVSDSEKVKCLYNRKFSTLPRIDFNPKFSIQSHSKPNLTKTNALDLSDKKSSICEFNEQMHFIQKDASEKKKMIFEDCLFTGNDMFDLQLLGNSDSHCLNKSINVQKKEHQEIIYPENYLSSTKEVSKNSKTHFGGQDNKSKSIEYTSDYFPKFQTCNFINDMENKFENIQDKRIYYRRNCNPSSIKNRFLDQHIKDTSSSHNMNSKTLTKTLLDEKNDIATSKNKYTFDSMRIRTKAELKGFDLSLYQEDKEKINDRFNPFSDLNKEESKLYESFEKKDISLNDWNAKCNDFQSQLACDSNIKQNVISCEQKNKTMKSLFSCFPKRQNEHSEYNLIPYYKKNELYNSKKKKSIENLNFSYKEQTIKKVNIGRKKFFKNHHTVDRFGSCIKNFRSLIKTRSTKKCTPSFHLLNQKLTEYTNKTNQKTNLNLHHKKIKKTQVTAEASALLQNKKKICQISRDKYQYDIKSVSTTNKMKSLHTDKNRKDSDFEFDEINLKNTNESAKNIKILNKRSSERCNMMFTTREFSRVLRNNKIITQRSSVKKTPSVSSLSKQKNLQNKIKDVKNDLGLNNIVANFKKDSLRITRARLKNENKSDKKRKIEIKSVQTLKENFDSLPNQNLIGSSKSGNNFSKFPPGWEHEVFEYKKSLKIPLRLITIKSNKNYNFLITSVENSDNKDSNRKSKIDNDQSDNSNSQTSSKSIIDILHSRAIKLKKEPIKYFKTTSAARRKAEPNYVKKKILNEKKKTETNSHFSVFDTKILEARTRTESRILKSKEQIREIFVGQERPNSAQPDLTALEVKNCSINNSFEEKFKSYLEEINSDFGITIKSENCSDELTKEKNQFNTKNQKKSKCSYEKAQAIEEKDANKGIADFINLETNSLKKSKIYKRKIKCRKKRSSGFDYIRKKKKNSTTRTPNVFIKTIFPKFLRKNETDLCKEIKSWVINKSLGQSFLHKAARLGYVDVIAYCLEKLNMDPNPKDNAGYTPLHEACQQGRIDIARLLLQYGANHSQAALSGIRPLHEASEAGCIEILRLLLSYGADPLLTTYGGQTPSKLAESEEIENFFLNYIEDLQNNPFLRKAWTFLGPWKICDIDKCGYNEFEDPPDSFKLVKKNRVDCNSKINSVNGPRFGGFTGTSNVGRGEIELFECEESDILLPPLYILKDEGTEKWLLLNDLCHILKIKSKETLLKQIFSSAPSSTGTKELIRELKVCEFLKNTTCLQLLCAGEKLNIQASKVVLIKYNDQVKNLLGVERSLIN